MGRLFLCYLEGRVYSCKMCKSHLAKVDELVSKSFHCRHGKAYLFNDVEAAYEISQKYKEGKFILERAKMTDDGSLGGGGAGGVFADPLGSDAEDN